MGINETWEVLSSPDGVLIISQDIKSHLFLGENENRIRSEFASDLELSVSLLSSIEHHLCQLVKL